MCPKGETQGGPPIALPDWDTALPDWDGPWPEGETPPTERIVLLCSASHAARRAFPGCSLLSPPSRGRPQRFIKGIDTRTVDTVYTTTGTTTTTTHMTDSTLFLQHTLSRDQQQQQQQHTQDYTSPFRSQLTTSFNRTRDLTTPPSKYNLPQLLRDNTARQEKQLNDLQKKEDNLSILKKSQIITDLTGREQQKKGNQEKQPQEKNKINNFAIDYDFIPVQEEEEEEEKNPIINEYIKDASELPLPSDNTDLYTISTDLQNELKQSIELNNIADAKDMILENNVKFNIPLDPSRAPKVTFNNNEKGSIGNNPLATPETPELIVKINKYGHLSKPIYDQVTYLNLVQENKIRDLKTKYNNHSQRKKLEIRDKIIAINNKKLSIQQKINEIKINHLNNLECIENDKIKKFFQINQSQTHLKYNLLHNTELIKIWKLHQLKFNRQRQILLQSQLNELSLEYLKFQNDYTLWNGNLIEKMEQLDAQLFKLKQINLRQDQLNNNITQLTKEKSTLQNDINNLESTHVENTKQINDLTMGKHDYNIKLDEINKEINTKQNLLSMIKQETINENLNLMNITNEIELAQLKQREEWEAKLDAKDNELSTTLTNLKLKHDQELNELQDSYKRQMESIQENLLTIKQDNTTAHDKINKLTESKLNLENEFKELQLTNEKQLDELTTKNKDMDQKLLKQQKLTELEQKKRETLELLNHENEIKMNYANQLIKENLKTNNNIPTNNNNNINNNDSIYSLITEEEIVYK